MQKAISLVMTLWLALAAGAATLAAESTCEYAVQANAVVQVSPPRITLNWPQDRCALPTGYSIYRKALAALSWGQGGALPGSATGYVDTNVAVGVAYEYQIVKHTSVYNGYGYVYAGIEVPPIEERGKLILVVDNTVAIGLTNELSQLQQDLLGDGWTVIRLNVNRNDSVTDVKSLIRAIYKTDPANIKCLFLFGHVPVPYSGNIVPDGHAPDHQGAWPCDGYYGDMDGKWTDSTVTTTRAAETRNQNVPGDGKFDQSIFPAPLRLMVGRVDMANMPGRLSPNGAGTFPSELELLRNYLAKDHKFRTRQFDLPRRAIVGDYFGVRDGEAFAASGWRNFAAFFDATNVSSLPQERTWIPRLSTNSYLWAYGCGAGTFTSIGGFGSADVFNDGTTTDLVQADPKAVFTLLFGSWLGDWDSEDDMLRSVLATPSYGLTSAWSGRPHWFLHHMALGLPIGFSARLTQNNHEGGLYQNQINNGAGQIHIALMGDPTLRMHVVAPPTNLELSTNDVRISLNWNPSQDTVIGYHVYTSALPGGPYTRLTTTPITCTHYADVSPASQYMVRAVKLELSGSGSYFNLSQGTFLKPSLLEGPVVGPLVSASPNSSVNARKDLTDKDFSEKVSSSVTNTPPLRLGANVL